MQTADSRTPLVAATTTAGQRTAALARLEAVLVLAREPLNSRKLSAHANLADATEARTLIRQLNERYDRRGRAFRVFEVAGGYQLLTRPQLASWLRRLAHTPAEVRLSSPALETLAVIAYRQPVGRADIEAIRGVSCGEMIRQLMDRDLVRIGGRSAELGRPYLYATTKRFLQIFGLSSLDDLPRAALVREAVVPAAADHQSRVVSEASESEKQIEEEDNVSVTTWAGAVAWEEATEREEHAALPTVPAQAADDDEDFEDEDDDDLDDDEEDDFEDDEDDLDEDDEEDDLEEEEWEEVDDEEEDDFEDEEDELEEDDEEWDDEDDDDLDDDDEEEDDDDWEDEE